MTPIRPSQLKTWDEIVQANASTHSTGGHPELYAWYKHESGIYYPHRQPTIDEILNDMFI